MDFVGILHFTDLSSMWLKNNLKILFILITRHLEVLQMEGGRIR
jgi:hypothetical protein